MSSEWVAAGFGLVGTVVGGLITLGANVFNSYAAKTQAAIDRQTHLVDRGYESQVAYSQSCQILMDEARELWAALVVEHNVGDAHTTYVEAWRSYVPARSTSQLSVPIAIKDSYEAYNSAIIDAVQGIDEYFDAFRDAASSVTPEVHRTFDRRLGPRFEAVVDKRRAFVEAGRAHFSGD